MNLSIPFSQSDVLAFRKGASAVRDESSALDSEARAGSARRTLAWAAGITALSTGAAGLTLNGLALNTSLRAEGESQRNLAASNQRIRSLNRASAVCYGAALAAGLTWAWARWWPESGVTFDAEAPDARATGLSLGISRSF